MQTAHENTSTTKKAQEFFLATITTVINNSREYFKNTYGSADNIISRILRNAWTRLALSISTDYSHIEHGVIAGYFLAESGDAISLISYLISAIISSSMIDNALFSEIDESIQENLQNIALIEQELKNPNSYKHTLNLWLNREKRELQAAQEIHAEYSIPSEMMASFVGSGIIQPFVELGLRNAATICRSTFFYVKTQLTEKLQQTSVEAERDLTSAIVPQ